MNKREERFLPLEEFRAEENDGAEVVITGYPIVTNQEIDMGEWREVIDPKATENQKLFRGVALMIGHNFGSIPLAHTRNNNENSTMQLTPDEHGVRMRATLDIANNPKAAEAYSAIKRGDLSGMSFAFLANEEVWEDLDSEKPLRRITGFGRIFECSLVAFPAYTGTSVQAASEGDALESVRASLESAREQMRAERARTAIEARRTAVLDWLENYKKEVSGI